jgi:hypothetical protein
MKENLDEKLITEILIKGTEMKAPKDLSKRILDRWKLEEESVLSFTPIFPKLTWWILAFLFAGLFIWGFSKMSFPDANLDIAIFMDQVLENLEYSMLGFEEIVLPTVVVLVIMVSLNTFLLKSQIFQRSVFG